MRGELARGDDPELGKTDERIFTKGILEHIPTGHVALVGAEIRQPQPPETATA